MWKQLSLPQLAQCSGAELTLTHPEGHPLVSLQDRSPLDQ